MFLSDHKQMLVINKQIRIVQAPLAEEATGSKEATLLN